MIVIKRTPHPNPEHRKITRRWFAYRGRTFGVTHAGRGYGWEVFDLEECSGVEDGYSNLDEVRRQAPRDIELWAADNDIKLGLPEGAHFPEVDPDSVDFCPDPARCWHGELFTGDCCECCGTVIA